MLTGVRLRCAFAQPGTQLGTAASLQLLATAAMSRAKAGAELPHVSRAGRGAGARSREALRQDRQTGPVMVASKLALQLRRVPLSLN